MHASWAPEPGNPEASPEQQPQGPGHQTQAKAPLWEILAVSAQPQQEGCAHWVELSRGRAARWRLISHPRASQQASKGVSDQTPVPQADAPREVQKPLPHKAPTAFATASTAGPRAVSPLKTLISDH